MLVLLCGSSKFPCVYIPSGGGSLEVHAVKGRVVSKAKVLKRNMKLHWNFQRKRHLLILKQEQFFANHTMPTLAVTWQMLYLPSATINVSD